MSLEARSSHQRHAHRLLLVAVSGEGLLACVGLAWIMWRGLPVRWGDPLRDTLIGLGCAAVFAVLQYILFQYGPNIWLIRSMRRLYSQLFRPIFVDLGLLQALAIGTMAGVGEELLFRGAIQHDWGWAPATLLFGILHVGSRATLALGLWALAAGGLLGLLAMSTGGLIAPIVAHGAYDVAALLYIARGTSFDVANDVTSGRMPRLSGSVHETSDEGAGRAEPPQRL